METLLVLAFTTALSLGLAAYSQVHADDQYQDSMDYARESERRSNELNAAFYEAQAEDAREEYARQINEQRRAREFAVWGGTGKQGAQRRAESFSRAAQVLRNASKKTDTEKKNNKKQLQDWHHLSTEDHRNWATFGAMKGDK